MIKYKFSDKISYKEHLFDFILLYEKTFSTGISAQYIDRTETENFFNQIFEIGFCISAFDEERLAAFLLYTPPSFDNFIQHEIYREFNDKNSIYIAEVLVDEQFRGQKIAQNLMKELENSLNKDIKNLILRVYDQNIPAIALYEKAGFKKIFTIFQRKLRPDKKTEFIMKKNYMLKIL